MEREFAKNTDSLETVFAFIAEFADQRQIKPGFTKPFELAIEEIFVNMVRYNTESNHDVIIQLNVEDNSLKACLIDRDVHYYDPTKRDPVDITRPIHEREPGGLGIHFVKEMMDDVIYEYDDRTCRITLVKRLGVK